MNLKRIYKRGKMDSGKKEIRIPKTSKDYINVLFQIKGRIGGKDIIISIAPNENNNYISDKLANQLAIPESNIGKRLNILDEKQYEISNLQLNIGDYTFTSQFIVQSLWSDNGDIILGSTWMDTLGTFILNTKKKFLTFSHKKKKITLQDIATKSNLEAPSDEDFKDISKVISQEKLKSIQKMQKEVEKFVTDKDEELTRLRNHNHSLLTQIKKRKNGNKSLQEKVDQLTNKKSKVDKETMTETAEIVTLSNVQIHTSEKGTSTDLIDVPVRENTCIKRVSSNQSVKEQKVEVSTNILQENKIPYHHPNHKSHYDQQYYTYRDNHQLAWKPKMRRHIQTVDQQTIPMKIDFGWITPQKMQHISSGIRKLYHLISSNVAVRSTQKLEKTLRARIRVKDKYFPNYALRTKHF